MNIATDGDRCRHWLYIAFLQEKIADKVTQFLKVNQENKVTSISQYDYSTVSILKYHIYSDLHIEPQLHVIREVKIATCTATCMCDVIVREGGIPSCRCERVNLTFSTPSSPSTRSTGTAGENLYNCGDLIIIWQYNILLILE